jgi:hypothetical protein
VADAASDLVKAMQLDRGFRPVWAWLGFHARQGNETAFWKGARQAFLMSHGDRRPLFELCWSLRPDAGFLFSQIVSRQAPVLMELVMFLMQRDQLDTAQAAYAALLEQPYGSVSRANAGRVATRDERAHVGMDLCDLLLDRGRIADAAGVWRLVRRWNLAGPGSAGRCFDFRRSPAPTPGVIITESGRGWQLEFSGRQEDEVDLLWRHPARAGLSEGAPAPKGMDRRLFLEERLVDGRRREVLVYQRPQGEVPLRGLVEVDRPW